MGTTNVRLDVARWLVTHLRDAIPEVQVEAGWPGDRLATEAIWVDEIAGTQELPVMLAGRRARDDRFIVPLEVRVASVPTSLDGTADRLSEVVAAVEDVLADSCTLDDDIEGVLSAEIASENAITALTPEGPRGFARIEVAVHVRLT